MSKLKAKNTLYNDPMYDVVVDSRMLEQYLKEKDQQLEELQNQTAIRELEKVKEFLLEKIAEKQSCFDSGNYNDFADGVKTICELMLISIENQIKELKGD